MILMFYTLVIVGTACNTFTMIYFAVNTEENLAIDYRDQFRTIEIFLVIDSTIQLSLGWLVTAIMYQLALSINLIF